MADQLGASEKQRPSSEVIEVTDPSSTTERHQDTASMTSDERIGIDISASEVGSRLGWRLEARCQARDARAGRKVTTYKSLMAMTIQAAGYKKGKVVE